MTILSEPPRRFARADQALSLTEFTLRQQGYTHAACRCGYSVDLASRIYNGDTCPAYLADDSRCNGTLELMGPGGAA